MPTLSPALVACNCLSLRQAARQISQHYDQHLAPLGLTLNQYSILANLASIGPTSVNDLAGVLVMDRTTLSRVMKPLQAECLLSLVTPTGDRRVRLLALTPNGEQLAAQAQPVWATAQAQFEQLFGADNALALRQTLHHVTHAVWPK
jgi:DNA-binding MarR family transcriptional regulator